MLDKPAIISDVLLDDVVVFSPHVLRKRLNATKENLGEKVKEYALNNNLDINKPKIGEYTLGIVVEKIGNSTPLFEDSYYETDLDLLIEFYTRISGDLYVPKRDMCFDNSQFEETYMFFKSEVHK